MQELVANLPKAVGTIPQWGMFLALLAILIKQAVPWRQMTISREAAYCAGLTKDIDSLKKELKECVDTNEAETKALHEELWGMRKQHIQEQISLINTIMRSVDAPELKNMVILLEHVQQSLLISQQKKVEENDQQSKGS